MDFDRQKNFENLLNILGNDAGIADVSGENLFGKEIPGENGENFVLPTENDVDAEGFFDYVEKQLLFKLIRPENSSPIWIYVSNENLAEKKKLLNIVDNLGQNLFASIFAQKSSFFKNLLTQGAQSVSTDEMELYTKKLSENYNEFAVIKIEFKATDADFVSGLFECITACFPENMDFEYSRVEEGVYCIICPLSEGFNIKKLQQTAAEFKDTVLSELMQNITVAVGGRVRQIKNIDASYKTADKAAAIGNLFEIDNKIYCFDNLGIQRLIYGLSRDVCTLYLREIFGNQFVEEMTKKSKTNDFNEELMKSVSKFLEYDLNISEASRALFVHRNTLIYRLDKFTKLTGLDCTKFDDAVKVKVGLLVLKYSSKIN